MSRFTENIFRKKPSSMDDKLMALRIYRDTGDATMLENLGMLEKQENVQVLRKAGPPGPKPAHFGDDVAWDESRRRWVKEPQDDVAEGQDGTDVARESETEMRGILEDLMSDSGAVGYGGKRPVNTIDDPDRVISIAQAVLRGEEVPPYVVWGAYQLTGSHRAAANAVLREMGRPERVQMISIEDLPEDVADDVREMAAYGDFREIDRLLDEAQVEVFRKSGPPGPPPREGLEWKEETKRWVRPDEEPGEDKPKRGYTKKPFDPSKFTNYDFSEIDELENDLSQYVIDNHESLSEEFAQHVFAAQRKTYQVKAGLKNIDDKSLNQKQSSLRLAVSNLREMDDRYTEALEMASNENYAIAEPKVRELRNVNRRLRRGLEKVSDGLYVEEFEREAELCDMFLMGIYHEYERATQPDSVPESETEIGKARQYLDDAIGRMQDGDKKVAYALLEQASQSLWYFTNTLYMPREESKLVTTARAKLVDLRNPVDLSNLVPPTVQEGMSIKTGKPLVFADDLEPVNEFNLSEMILLPGIDWADRQEEPMKSDIDKISQMLDKSAQTITSQLKPEFQRKFQTTLGTFPVSVHMGKERWAKKVEKEFGDEFPYGIEDHNVGGYAKGASVNIPDSADMNTIIHEIGHVLDLERPLSKRVSGRMRKLYAKKLARNNINGLKKDVVRPYAASNMKEFFAESFSKYLTYPDLLYSRDPETYQLLSEELFQ